MARLRAPGGCPWDREQSFDSIRKYTLEETYEVFDAIERRDFPHLAEELGDLLLQVLFYAEMAANEGHFTIADVLDHLNSKLVRRHPHVFGEEASRAAGNRADVDAAVEGSSAAVLRNWEEIKAAEKHCMQRTRLRRRDLRHRGWIPSSGRCRRWPRRPSWAPRRARPASTGPTGAICCPSWPKRPRSWRPRPPPDDPARKPAVEAELGDLLFTVVNLGRHLGVDAEMALRGCNLRFRQRFRAMELASERPLEELVPGGAWKRLWAASEAEAGRSQSGGAGHDRDPRLRRASTSWRPASNSRSRPGATTRRDVIPRKAFLVAQKIGGQVIGAFDTEICRHSERRPGVAGGLRALFAGIKTYGNGAPRPYLHSHMLAVQRLPQPRPGHATQAGATREALTRGIRQMEWTFDPLEIKNAYLNIHKLGAIVRRTGGFLWCILISTAGWASHGPLVAEWQLDSPRVEAVLEGRPAAAHVIEERISVPASIYEWKASEAGRERALAVQLENREGFKQAFSQGLAVVGFTRDAEGNGVFELGLPTSGRSWS